MSGIARLFTPRVDSADSIEFPVDQRDDFTVKVATCQESNEFFFFLPRWKREERSP